LLQELKDIKKDTDILISETFLEQAPELQVTVDPSDTAKSITNIEEARNSLSSYEQAILDDT